MPYHNVSASISQADHAALIAQINSIKSQLPFLVNLTPKERQAGAKGHNKLAFVMAAHDYAAHNAPLLPTSLNYTEWTSDIALLQQVSTLLQAVNMLQFEASNIIKFWLIHIEVALL
jgi:hypothetical protein